MSPTKRVKLSDSSRPPANGTLRDGLVAELPPVKLAVSPTIQKWLVNEHFRSQRVLEKNYPLWSRRRLNYWSTPRLSGSGACLVLTNRGSSDLANQLRFEEEYTKTHPPDAATPYKPPPSRGIVVNPSFVEWMQGLPTGWTSVSADVGAPTAAPQTQRLRTLDLFTGCGGLTLGLHQWCQAVGYCEVHPKYRAILEARIESGHLDTAEVFTDINEVNAAGLLVGGVGEVDLICAGFPCQNISNAGDKRGLEGTKTSLFYQVVRLIGEVRPPYVLLENVSAITCKGMSYVLRTVVESMDCLGYDAQWGIFEARQAGAPHRRKRWFLLATRRDVGPERLRSLVPSLSSEQQAAMSQSWLPEPALEQRLLSGSQKDTKVRLETMGNMVCVKQAELAFRYLAHGGLR